MNDESYVYELAYPESMGGAVFYVGKGTDDRINQHEDEARKGVKSAKCDAIRSIWARGEEVIKRKVYETSIEQDAYIYEWVLVNLVHGYENLTNFWEGGNGGTVKRTALYKTVSLVISRETLVIIDAVTPDTRAGYIRRVLQTELTENMQDVINHPVLPCLLEIQSRTYNGVSLPLDTVSRLETIPRGIRSAVVEFLLRSQVGLL